MDKVTKESLQEEHKNLLNAVRDDDTAFIGLLDTISNFHKYPLSAQLTFFYHAPKGTRTIASREIWERSYGTSIVGNADAIPMLDENNQVSYVYDVRDTVGFLQGDERLYHIPWSYDETRDENALRLAFKAEDNVSIDDALRAHIQNKVINSNYPSHVASAVEYIVRQRLGLATDDTSLRSMDRENIPSEQLLIEISQTARDILDDIQMNIVNERKEQNVREARERLRNVGRSSEELPEAGEARDVETDRRGGGDRDLSQGVRGESVGESRTSDGTTQEEDASDGRTEEEGRNGLHPEDESGSADRNGIDAGRNQGLKELPTLSGLSSEDAENAFRGYVEGINNAVASGTIDIDAARGYYRDGVMLIVSGEGSFTPEKRDELTVLVVDTLKATYDRQQRPADDQQEEEPEQTVEKHPENEPEPVEADVEPEKEPEQTVEKHPETEPEPAESTFAMGSSIYDWYHSAHPTDDAAESIHRDITFQDVLDHLESGEDFYAYTGVSESDIRESIFTELSSLSGRSYDELYQLYLNANNVQTVEQDNESAPETKTYKYYLLHRPVSMGTQPDDFVRFADDEEIRQEQNMLTDAFRRNIMGIVYYDHPLTEQQINEYELIDASIVKKRMELVRSYYETQQEVPSWIKDFTFQELYDALENGTDYPTFLGLANDNDVPAPYYGKIIAADYMAYGKELANRMNVNSHYIFQLMAQNYVKETANALRFMRKSNQEQEAREEDRESTTETKQNSIDYANMAVSPAFSSTLNDLQSVFSSEATMSSIMNQFDWMMTDHLYLALGLLHHEHPELRERIAEYLTELNYHGEVKYLEKGEYDAYFNSMDTINQYLAQHPLNVAIQDEAISQAAQNVMALVAKDEAWRTNPPFDTTPYLQAKERIREQLDSENWLEYREAIEQKVRQADQITEIALMLNYIEQPRLRNKVLMCEGADSSLYKNLVDGAYEDYLAFFHIALHAAEETKEEPEIQPEIKTEEAAPAKTAEQERTPDGNRIDLSTLDLTADLSTVSGRRAVFLRNIAAIQIVHDLEKTNRQPTEQELAVLRSYAGFGALPDVFDPNASNWRREYQMAKDNLTETEYASAKESTLSAFYTPKEVIDGIYEGLEAGGITGGINILDPSTGTGRFLSDMPDSVKSNSHLFGVELDELSSKIAKYANPDADITKSPFEDTTFPDNAFDLAISNVPFGNFPINDSRYSGHNYMIHDYFINRMIDEVRPGGIVVAITSKGTMDKVNNAARKDFARKAELIKGIRLPEEVFNGAGTNTVSDILIFRKREKELGPDDELPEWVNSSNRSFDGYPILYHVNDYFYNHPENVKGFLRVKSSSIGDTVTVMSEDYNEQSLKDIISDSIRDAGVFFHKAAEPLPVPEQKPVVQHDHEYGYLIRNGQLIYMTPEGELQDAGLSGTAEKKVRSAVKIRDHIRMMLNAELEGCTDERLGVLQAALNQLYDNHVKQFGPIYKDRELGKIFNNDFGYAILLSLEEVEDNKLVGKSDIFTKRTISAQTVPTHVDTATDALMVSIQEKGKVNIPYMAELTGKSKTEIVHDLEFSEIYEDIEHHRFVTADEYLSGDIRGRMEYLEEQLDDWTEELHELAASEIIDLPSGEYPFFSEKDFPELYDEETHKLYPRKLTNEQMAQLFEPENREKALFFLNNVSTYWLNDVIKYAKLGNPNLAQKFDDPAFAFEFWRSGKVNNSFMPFYLFNGYSKLEASYDYIQRDKSRLTTKPVSELAIHAFLKKMSDDYSHGSYETKAKLFTHEYIDENFESFTKDFDARIAEKSENISGDIAESLRDDIARAKKNLAALEKVKPKDLTADEIDIFLGAPWVKTDDIKQFAVDTFGYDGSIEVEYSDISGAWKVSTGYSGGLNQADSVYGIKDRNAFELLQAALNHTQINVMKEVSDAKGGTKRVINREQTLLAARKIQDIRDAFHNWIFKDEERKDRYVSYYNRHFNNIVPRHFDGSRLTFPGMNPEIELRPHQKDAVARTLFGGNTLLAHVVGAGKTFEMQASAMESKRIGLCHKSMMIMPKHLTQQFGSEFQRLYPNAKILVAEPKDFTAAGRQEFCAKIMAKDWDAVVLSYEQFGKIPLSFERRSKFLQDEAHKILNAIDEMKKNKGKRFTIKQAEREYKKIKDQLEKLEEDYHKHQDSTLTFEQLGIDRLYVDESHFYKNLGFFTRIPGIQSNHVQKTDDMLAKCDYINELTNERGIVFASGTPISNSMAELYTLSRYLKPSRLKSQGLEAFDSWASTFGDQVTQMELEPAGDKFRQKTRFSHFANVPELVSMFKEFADVKLADQLKLPVPNSHLKLITAEPSQVQRGMIDDLIERSDFIKKGNPKIVNEEAHKVDEAKGIDNMLNITREGREIALDPRLIDPELPDYPESKLNLCVNNVVKIYKDTADKKSTQLVFCDIGTPSTDKKKFSVYDDIKEKLMAQGIKEKEIAFIHSYETPKKKEELFKKVRKGEVRVLLGSSDKLGVGTNVQDKIVAMHELDCPWKPAQIEQRRGRGIRVGNENSDVDIYRYVTKGTFDAYMWQTNEFKQKFISQVMTSTAPSRVCDDVDDFQLEASQIKTACTENPLFQEQMSLDNEVRILKMERAQFYDSRKTLEHLLTILPAEIQNADKKLNFLNDDLSLYAKGEGQGFVVGDKEYKGKEIGKYLSSIVEKCYKGELDGSPRGTYHGLKFTVLYNPKNNPKPLLCFYGKSTYMPCTLVKDADVDLERFENIGNYLKNTHIKYENEKEDLNKKLSRIKEEYAQPFYKQDELEAKEKRLSEVNALVLISNKENVEKEQTSRLEAIQSRSVDIANPCTEAYVNLANTQLDIHGSPWKPSFDKEIAKALSQRGFDKEQIVNTIFIYSPSAPTKDEAISLIAEPKKQIAACR